MATLNKDITNSHDQLYIWERLEDASFFNKVDLQKKFTVDATVTTITLHTSEALTAPEVIEWEGILADSIGMLNKGEPEDQIDILLGSNDNYSNDDNFGENASISSSVSEASPQDIVDGGGKYVPPTQDRVHQIKSASNQDKGVLRGTYESTTFGPHKFIDSTATFVTDGVVVGDLVINDTTCNHTIVTNVTSETELDTESWSQAINNNVGDTFRIAGSAGSGPIALHIEVGWTKKGDKKEEYVILNGMTNVPTVNSYYRANKARVYGAGTNVALITMTADTDTTITLQIPIGKEQTSMAFGHVPCGYEGYITSWYSSMYRNVKVADAMAKVYLRSRPCSAQSDKGIVEHAMGVSVHGGEVPKEFKPYRKIRQGTDVWIRCSKATDGNTEILGGFDLILKKL